MQTQPKKFVMPAGKCFFTGPGNRCWTALPVIFQFIENLIAALRLLSAFFRKLLSGRYKKLVFFILGIIFFKPVFSQENFVSGTVINAQGDTIAGLIDYQNWKKNPRKVKFKTAANEPYSVYTPLDIVEFRVRDEIYIGRIVECETSSLDAGGLMEDPGFAINIDTVFLQALIRGRKSLYLNKNIDGKDNFYIENNSKIELLLYKKYLKNTEGKSIVKEQKKYIGQLLLYLTDCPALQQEIEKAAYNRRSLEKVFQNYYKCSGDQIIFKKELEKPTVEFGVLAGATITSLNFKSKGFEVLVNTDFKHSTRFTAGLRLELFLPRIQRKLSINNELLFTSYEVAGEYLDFESDNKYSITTTKIGYSHIRFINMVRYTYSFRKTRFFMNAGISNSYSVSNTNYSRKESKFFTINSTEIGKAFNVTRTYEQGFNLGVGVKRLKISAEFRYERGNGMSVYSALNSITNRYYFLLGYGF